MHHIIHAKTPADYADAKLLIAEYGEVAVAEDRHIGGMRLEDELAKFPGPYVAPKGAVWLARAGDAACGCLMLRPISERDGEVMRMYVSGEFRGQGIAEAMLKALIAEAKSMAYERLFLFSLKKFTSAHKLYEKAGFSYCEPYASSVTEDMKKYMFFMRLDIV